MRTGLPVISAAGIFDSRQHFQGTQTRPRRVVDYELEIFTEDGGMSHINDSSYPIKKGCMLLAKPGDRRWSSLHFTALFVHFGAEDPALQQLLHSLAGFYPAMEGADWASELQEICDVAVSLEPESDLLAGAMLTSFLCRMKKGILLGSKEFTGNTPASVVSMSIEFMKQNFHMPLTVETVARHCCVSASHLHKIFLQTAHTTPGEYLIQLRLGEAKALLRTTNLPISEVAARSGFNSQAYFSDCFKRHIGVSPKNFRTASRYPEEQLHNIE